MATVTKDVVGTQEAVEEKKFKVSENQWKMVIKRIQRNKVATVSFYYIMLNVLIAIFYPLFISFDPFTTAPGNDRNFGGGANAAPSLKYPAGTTLHGRDGFSQLIIGAEVSLLVGFVATFIAIFIGTLMGLFSGYFRGITEEILMRITDLFLSVPFLIVALILIASIQSETAPDWVKQLKQIQVITVVIGVFSWAGLARLVNANVKQVANLEYIDAIRLIGAGDRRIIFIHVLPNVLSGIVILSALLIAGSILSEAGLSFLGFGDPTSTVSWGSQVNFGIPNFSRAPHEALIPGFAIFFLVLAINLFGDALTEALDPRLKQ